MDRPDRGREDDWFRKNEEQLLEKARKEREHREAERAKLETEAERKRLRELHWMRCPKCGHELKPETYSKVTVERCSFCEGLYLDAGELEDLMRTAQAERQGIVRRLLRI